MRNFFQRSKLEQKSTVPEFFGHSSDFVSHYLAAISAILMDSGVSLGASSILQDLSDV